MMCSRMVKATLSMGLLLAGCAEEKSPPPRHPGDDLLKDPMGYKPTMEDPNISGGGLLHLDKPGLKKDVNGFFNP